MFDMSMTSSRGSNFGILLVCTGNICRSPLAQLLLQKQTLELPIVVASAGTRALVGHSIHEESSKIALELRLGNGSAHKARQLTVAQIRESDLILTMDRQDRRRVVETLPRASRRTFTIREFARLSEHVSRDRLDEMTNYPAIDALHTGVEFVAQLRGSLPLLDKASNEDVSDPFGGDRSAFRTMAEELIPTTAVVSNFLCLAVSGDAHEGNPN